MTKEEIGRILKDLRQRRGMTQKEIAEKIGRTQQIIGHWETGYAQPDANTLFVLCGIYGVTVDEAFGFNKDKISASDIEFIKKYKALDPHGKETVDITIAREEKRMEQIRNLEKQIKNMEASEELVPKRLFAYYGRIAAAGKSFTLEDMVVGTIAVEENDDNRNADYTIGVWGDSMEPTYTGEDIVYVQKTTHINKGDVGIFQKDNCIYIKEVGDEELISHNLKYDPIPGKGVIVLGKVVGKVDGAYEIIK